MTRTDIFQPELKAQPWWWEAWTPNNTLSQDPPARTDVVAVGAWYRTRDWIDRRLAA